MANTGHQTPRGWGWVRRSVAVLVAGLRGQHVPHSQEHAGEELPASVPLRLRPAGQVILLPLEEPESSALTAPILEREGITVRTGVAAASVAATADAITVTLADGSTVSGERLLVATGRRADLKGLGVAAAGIDDEDSLCALGRVAGRPC